MVRKRYASSPGAPLRAVIGDALRRRLRGVAARPLGVCAYYRGAKNNNTDEQAVDEAAVALRIAVDPWRYKDPDAEGRIDPAQAGFGGVNGSDRGEDDDQRADNPAVPVAGTPGYAIDPWRKEKPQSDNDGEGTRPPRRMSIHSGRRHGFYLYLILTRGFYYGWEWRMPRGKENTNIEK